MVSLSETFRFADHWRRERERRRVLVPLVVGMGAALAAMVSWMLPLLVPRATAPGVDDQAMLVGLAVVTFTLCAFLARLVDCDVRCCAYRRSGF